MDPAQDIGFALAFLAGLVSFLSPCVLPIVPGYLATITGMSPTERQDQSLWKTLLPALLFVCSFSTIFVLLGVTASGLGSLLATERLMLEKISGALILAMGLLLLLSLTPWARGLPVPQKLLSLAHGSPLIAGAAFAFAWTPCVGPTLAAILSAAALEGSAVHGALLLAVYSAGLALPFLASALAFQKIEGFFNLVKRHYFALMLTSGLILTGMGLLLLTGQFFELNIWAQKFMNELGLNPSSTV